MKSKMISKVAMVSLGCMVAAVAAAAAAPTNGLGHSQLFRPGGHSFGVGRTSSIFPHCFLFSAFTDTEFAFLPNPALPPPLLLLAGAAGSTVAALGGGLHHRPCRAGADACGRRR